MRKSNEGLGFRHFLDVGFPNKYNLKVNYRYEFLFRGVMTGQLKCHPYDVVSYLTCLAKTTVMRDILQMGSEISERININRADEP